MKKKIRRFALVIELVMCESCKPSPECGELNASAARGRRAVGNFRVLDEVKASNED